MGIDAVINGGLAFAAVLILMVLNVPIGIAMLVVGFTGFAMISGFDPAIFVLGTAPFDAVSKYTLSVCWFWNDLWIVNCYSCNNVSNGRS